MTRPLIADIQDAAAAYYGLSRADLKSDQRNRRVVDARHLAMLLARQMTGHSLATIGNAFGGRHHGTVLYGIERAEEAVRRTIGVEVAYRSILASVAAAVADRAAEAGVAA